MASDFLAIVDLDYGELIAAAANVLPKSADDLRAPQTLTTGGFFGPLGGSSAFNRRKARWGFTPHDHQVAR